MNRKIYHVSLTTTFATKERAREFFDALPIEGCHSFSTEEITPTLDGEKSWQRREKRERNNKA